MHHDVLDLGEFLFNGGVDSLGDRVRLAESEVAVDSDLDIDIDLVAEHSGMEHIDALDAFLFNDTLPEPILCFGIAGMVHHLIDSVLEDIRSRLADEQTDQEAGDGIEDGESEPRADDTDQSADGGEGVAAVVPCVSHQST